jgi:hypothetical protein
MSLIWDTQPWSLPYFAMQQCRNYNSCPKTQSSTRLVGSTDGDISFAPIIFPKLRDLVLHCNAKQVEMKSKLLEACEIAKEQYGNIKRTKSIMPESVAVLEFMGSKLYE